MFKYHYIRNHAMVSSRCGSGDLQIGFAFAAADDLDNGGPGLGWCAAILRAVRLVEQLQQFGFNLFTFVLVHHFSS